MYLVAQALLLKIPVPGLSQQAYHWPKGNNICKVLEKKRVFPELGLIINNAVAGSDAVDEGRAVLYVGGARRADTLACDCGEYVALRGGNPGNL